MAVPDHLVYATPDVAATTALLAEQLGVTPGAGGRHLGRGTHNTLLALGGRTYLEVIGPDPDAPAPAGPRPFGVDGLTEPRLITWAAAVEPHSLDSVIGTARQRAYDPGDAATMQRRTPAGELLSWALTMPPMAASGELVGVIPFLIDWLDTPRELHPSQSSPGGCRLESFEVGHPDPDRIRSVFDALGLVVAVVAAPLPTLSVEITGPSGRVRLG